MGKVDHVTQRDLDFARIERAMRYLAANYREHPGLERIAEAAHLSPYHFQRLFTRWAGVSPSQFLRYLTVERAKRSLDESESVLDAALDAGLSGPGRLHDLFVAFEAVTPGEYKAMGHGLEIRWGVHDGPFGAFVAGATTRGVCALEFLGEDGAAAAVEAIARRWPRARMIEEPTATAELGPRLARGLAAAADGPIRLWVKGTNFQIRVWEALLRVPPGGLTSYGALARALGAPGSARAVGNAVGANPVGWIIPCHRVIRETALANTGYRWGTGRKLALIGWEAARAEAARHAA